jgi:hypothetical protein
MYIAIGGGAGFFAAPTVAGFVNRRLPTAPESGQAGVQPSGVQLVRGPLDVAHWGTARLVGVGVGALVGFLVSRG